jgi:Trypsin-co-occurring domain 1
VTEIVQFETGHGPVLVEVAEGSVGTERIAPDQVGVPRAETRLDEALQAARPAIRAVLDTLRELVPEEHVVEFGIKLNAEAGVLLATSPSEGHFTVKITWRRDTTSEGQPVELGNVG